MSRKIYGTTVTTPLDYSEVKDIRTGFDGAVYKTAGEAVRAQVAAAMQSGASGGLNSTASALLVAILKNAVFTSNQSENISALEAALASPGGSVVPDSGVEQNGNILAIVSGVSVTKNEDVLSIA